MSETANNMGATQLTAREEWLSAVAKRSHAIEDLPQAIIDDVRNAKMDSRHNPLNRLM